MKINNSDKVELIPYKEGVTTVVKAFEPPPTSFISVPAAAELSPPPPSSFQIFI
jgi:hypothetical protein